VATLEPFFGYIEWNEKRINDTLINEIGWSHNADKGASTWRTDCYMAPLKKILYSKMLGFNDMDDHLSALVRGGQITRDTALARLAKESSVPDQVLSNACTKLGIDRGHMEESIKRALPTDQSHKTTLSR
jgi:hypothetical protein